MPEYSQIRINSGRIYKNEIPVVSLRFDICTRTICMFNCVSTETLRPNANAKYLALRLPSMSVCLLVCFQCFLSMTYNGACGGALVILFHCLYTFDSCDFQLCDIKAGLHMTHFTLFKC